MESKLDLQKSKDANLLVYFRAIAVKAFGSLLKHGKNVTSENNGHTNSSKNAKLFKALKSSKMRICVYG